MFSETSIFISYAWGGPIAKKEWLRAKVISYLELVGFSIFWDRDKIRFGQSVDKVIAQALAARPLYIFCICEYEYITSANQDASGLQRELKMIEAIADCDDVFITPVFIDAGVKTNLPDVLRGRVYIDLVDHYNRGLDLGELLASIASGANQSQIALKIAKELRRADLLDLARAHFKKRPVEFSGNPISHKVRCNEKILLPPEWMFECIHWANRLKDDLSGFSPLKGIWHWDHWSPSTGMRALGTAVCSIAFANETGQTNIAALEGCGDILAQRVFSMIKKTEPFILTSEEIVNILLMSDATDSLEKLLR